MYFYETVYPFPEQFRVLYFGSIMSDPVLTLHLKVRPLESQSRF